MGKFVFAAWIATACLSWTLLGPHLGQLIEGYDSRQLAKGPLLVVALATPLLLLSADLSVILQRTGLMLRAFVCGAIGTALGSVLGFWLVRVHHAV